jgi:hypothetical protein
MIANLIVVVNGAGRVENDILTNDSAGVDNYIGANHASQTNLYIWGNYGRWMPGNNELFALLLQSCK